MTYRGYYGDVVAVASRDAHLDERVRSERFSTEHEALQRARELIEQDVGPRSQSTTPPATGSAVCACSLNWVIAASRGAKHPGVR